MKTILRSRELSCPSCVAKIEKQLSGIAGVESAVVHFNTGKIEVLHDPEQAPQDVLVKVVREAGYESQIARI